MTNVTFTTDINTYGVPFFTADGYQISEDVYDLSDSILWDIPQSLSEQSW